MSNKLFMNQFRSSVGSKSNVVDCSAFQSEIVFNRGVFGDKFAFDADGVKYFAHNGKHTDRGGVDGVIRAEAKNTTHTNEGKKFDLINIQQNTKIRFVYSGSAMNIASYGLFLKEGNNSLAYYGGGSDGSGVGETERFIDLSHLAGMSFKDCYFYTKSGNSYQDYTSIFNVYEIEFINE